MNKNMSDKEYQEITKIIDDWLTFKRCHGVDDIMPYVVYLKERLDNALEEIDEINRKGIEED